MASLGGLQGQAGLFGGLGGSTLGLQELSNAGIAAQRAAYERQLFGIRPEIAPLKIKDKPTIEAGDPIREVLQAETDEWLKDLK